MRVSVGDVRLFFEVFGQEWALAGSTPKRRPTGKYLDRVVTAQGIGDRDLCVSNGPGTEVDRYGQTTPSVLFGEKAGKSSGKSFVPK